MKIKIGDYVKLNDGSDWKRVCVCHDDYFKVEGYWSPTHIDTITEVLPYGELVEASMDGKTWKKRIFIAYDKGFEFPFRCVSPCNTDSFKHKNFMETMSWEYARPIGKVKITWENKEKWISKDDAKALFEEDKS